ncbi:MAG: PmoA family protein [Planctomycetota bacterium]
MHTRSGSGFFFSARLRQVRYTQRAIWTVVLLLLASRSAPQTWSQQVSTEQSAREASAPAATPPRAEVPAFTPEQRQALPNLKPIPRMQVTPLPADQISIQREGVEITRYHLGPNLRRPFLFPVMGPSGRSVTRMGHPRDPHSHSHHNSIWVAHNDVNGVDFWADPTANPQGKLGRIVLRKIDELEDGDEEARIRVTNDWIDHEGRRLLEERRQIRIRPLEAAQWWLDLELEFKAVSEPVTLGKSPFGMVAVRMAKTIGVRDGGGLIRNSEAGENEAGVFWKAARWVDYSGPIAPGKVEGVTLLNHPSNPTHPVPYHVRDDGWMGATVSFAAPRVITSADPLRLRYGIWIHREVASAESIEAQVADWTSRK